MIDAASGERQLPAFITFEFVYHFQRDLMAFPNIRKPHHEWSPVRMRRVRSGRSSCRLTPTNFDDLRIGVAAQCVGRANCIPQSRVCRSDDVRAHPLCRSIPFDARSAALACPLK